MKVESVISVALVMLLATGLAAMAIVQSAPEEPKWGGDLVFGSSKDAKSFMILYQGDELGQVLMENVFTALIAVDWTRWQIVPGLAHSWEMSPDAVTYTFHLYENATWHDGVKCTSADVKFSLDGAVFDPPNRVTGYIGDIKEVQTPDEYTVVIVLEGPNSNFLNNLAKIGGPMWTVIPKHLYEGTDWRDNPYNLEPIGNGPFKFVEHVLGSHIILEANEDYFKGRPYVDRLIFKIVPNESILLEMLRSGEVDYIGCYAHSTPFSKLPEIDSWPTCRVHAIPQMIVQLIGFNLDRPPYDDVKVREAFAYGIDRDEILDKAFWGYAGPGEGWYCPAHWAFNPNATLPDYDPEKAEELLDDAGYPRGSDGIRFTTEIVWAGIKAGFAEVSAILKEHLRVIGIDLVITPMEMSTWVEKACQRHDFDISLRGYAIGPTPDKLAAFLTPGILYNFMNYNSTEFVQLLDEARLTTDISERKEIYWRMQELLMEDNPYIILAEPATVMLANNEWHNFPTDWMEIDPDHPAPVSMAGFRLAWWEKGTEVSSSSAAAAIEEAERKIAELEEAGNDVKDALALLEEAKNDYEAGDYTSAQTKAKEAITLAVAPPPPYPLYVGVGAGCVIILIAAVVLYRRRKKT